MSYSWFNKCRFQQCPCPKWFDEAVNSVNSLHSFPHIRNWQPHVLAGKLRSISYCRNSAYIRVRFWRHVRIGRILSRCFCNIKRKETAYKWGVTYQTEYYGYYRKENKGRNKIIKIIYQTTQYVFVCVMSCDILDHVAGEIRSNKARVIPNSYVITVTFPNFGVDWANSFQVCRSAHLKQLYLFKYSSVLGRVLLNDDHKTNHRSRLVTKDNTRVSLSTSVPRISDIVRRKQAKKGSLSGWLVKIVCHFSKKKN